jgi:hypothetical protein
MGRATPKPGLMPAGPFFRPNALMTLRRNCVFRLAMQGKADRIWLEKVNKAETLTNG